MTILSNRWDGTEESAQWTNSAINAVIDTLVNANMWTGDPPYRGKTPAEQVQMLVDERNALRAKLDAVPEYVTYCSVVESVGDAPETFDNWLGGAR